MKILVTGASGFLGRHLLPLLSAHEVVALCRSPERLPSLPHVTPTGGDVLDAPQLARAMEGCDAVIHSAGGVSHRAEDAGWMRRVHVQGTENALLAAKAAGVRRFVHLSTSGTVAISTDSRAVANEDSPTPRELLAKLPYYRAKHYAELSALAVKPSEGLEVICLNPSLLLGPGDEDRHSVRPIELLLEGWLRACPPGGLSFVDVRDVADACVRALTRGVPGSRYLLGATNMTFSAFYRRVGAMCNKPAPALRLPSVTGKLLGWLPGAQLPLMDHVDPDELERGCLFWYLDSAKAEKELGWRPRDPGETLLDTVQDLQSDRPWR